MSKKRQKVLPTSVHRIIEQPVNNPTAVVHRGDVEPIQCNAIDFMNLTGRDILEMVKKQNYAIPKQNTLCYQQCELEALKELQQTQIKTETNLTPRSQAIIAPKITAKLNFAPDRPVFKNLTSLNINESVLIAKESLKSRNKPKSKTTKLPEPEMYDYMEPLPPIDYTSPKQSIRLNFPEQTIDYYEIYKKTYK